MGATKRGKLHYFLLNNAIYIVLLMIIVVLVWLNPMLLSGRNISYILSQAEPRIILALAVGGIIILGGTDLSAGRILGMAGLFCASLLQATDYPLRIYQSLPRLPLVVPLFLAMVLCCFFTVSHSLLVSRLKVAPFIASLGIQLVVYGSLSLYGVWMNNSSPVAGFDKAYTNFAGGSIQIFGFRVAYIFLYAIAVTLFIWAIWNKTSLGKRMYAVGGNPDAAIVSGINVTRVFMLVYLIAGVLYAFSGFLEAARTGSANNQLGEGYELDAIAACVVGGVSMRGGIGKVSGIISGVFIFQMITYGLVFMGVNSFVQYIVKGLIILFAIAVDTQKYVKKR